MSRRHFRHPGTPDSRAEPADPDTPVSKSQRKREAEAWFRLGRQLAALPGAELRRIVHDPELLEAITTAQSIASNVARKRQLGFVARVLRLGDGEAIRAALAERQSEARRETAGFHRVERWRDGLIEHGDAWLTALLLARPDADRQSLRQLQRNAVSEAARGKPPAAARKLFRRLRELDGVDALPPPPATP